MKIALLASQELPASWNEHPSVVRLSSPQDWAHHTDADAWIDLDFEPSEERLTLLRRLLPQPVIVGSVVHTLASIGEGFVRINHWPGFIEGGLIEASGALESQAAAQAILETLGSKTEWLPDTPGFITPRVVSMVINEAYRALEEGVSSRAEIDTAMKLGTNYPYGPFEWAERIGVHRVEELLQTLAQTEERYAPPHRLAGRA